VTIIFTQNGIRIDTAYYNAEKAKRHLEKKCYLTVQYAGDMLALPYMIAR
jgi:hypothetical protein